MLPTTSTFSDVVSSSGYVFNNLMGGILSFNFGLGVTVTIGFLVLAYVIKYLFFK